MNGLNDSERQRYVRHLVLEQIGENGQTKLKDGRVLVVGTGGLGSPVLYYLAAAGVGTVGLVDNDRVELSNLQRQILHRTGDLGKPKAISAYEKLADLNPEIEITAVQERLTKENAAGLIEGYQVIVDATDNFLTRFIINRACVEAGKPFVHAGILGFFGQAMTVLPGQGPCFQCLFRKPPLPDPDSAAPGVVGAVAGTMGTIQAAEVLKLLLGSGKPLVGRLLMYDAMEGSFREVQVKRDPSCPVCATVN